MKAKETFKVGENKIGYVASSFLEEFGDEEVREGSMLKFDKLSRYMTDSEIIKEFGVQECTLGDVLATLKDASEELKDGYANIFYIKGHARVVNVYWFRSGWGVDDWGRGGRRWHAGRRVFSSATETHQLGTGSFDPLTLENAIKICKEAGLKVIRVKMVEKIL